MSASAEQVLRGLVSREPYAPGHWLQLAALLEGQGKLPAAEECYGQLIARLPELAVAHFNLACFLRRRGRLEEALREHQQALDLNIDQPEEVLSNMGVIHTELRQDTAARSFLERALAIRPTYIPAMFNLALLLEEFGDLQAALELFERILDQDPTYYDALIRIAYARPIRDRADPVVRKLQRALRRSHIDPLTRESLHFALGKACDDCGLFDEAFAHYQSGNRESATRLRPYDRPSEATRVSEILRMFTPQWLAAATPVSSRPLVFITGMFRSGSTLIEQVLSQHPRVAAGGEIDYFHRQLAQSGMRFPGSLADIGPGGYHSLGTGYLEYLDKAFPSGAIITNKRPDSFEFLGLLKALFPNARFVNTVRDPLDTCLSIYFEQLDDRVAYASDLGNIAHHWQQYRKLMQHWQGLFGPSIIDVDYDDFVVDPGRVTEQLLRFLDLEWHEGCLDFQRSRNRVRTASVRQVREPVYRKSSGRWRNYERHLEPVQRMLATPAGG